MHIIELGQLGFFIIEVNGLLGECISAAPSIVFMNKAEGKKGGIIS